MVGWYLYTQYRAPTDTVITILFPLETDIFVQPSSIGSLAVAVDEIRIPISLDIVLYAAPAGQGYFYASKCFYVLPFNAQQLFRAFNL